MRALALPALVVSMTLLRPVTLGYEGEMLRGRFLRREDRFTAHIKLDACGSTVACHCINPGRMEAFVDEGAVVWARKVPEAKKGPKRKLEYTWEIIERDGVACSTNTQRPNALVAAVLEARVLEGFRRATDVKAEKTIAGERSRVDFFCVDDDGFDHWIEVKNCHSTYPDEELLNGYGYFPDSVSERAAKHCRELAKLAAKPNTRCTVLIVASRADVTRGIRPSDYHDPGFAAAARAARDAGVVFRGLRATNAPNGGTTVDNEIPVDLDPPSDSALRALHRSWARAASITGWDRTFGADAPKRVANGPFKHNQGRYAAAEEAPPTATSAHFKAPTTFSPHFETPTPKKRKRKPAPAATPAP